MEGWSSGIAPEPYEVRLKDARYAVLLVMGTDGDMMGQIHSDFYEMTQGVSEDVAVLALADYPESECSRVVEALPKMVDPVCRMPSICTGDPRPIADFLARGLVSFTPETRFAIGFWGHGNGVFLDHDEDEVLWDRAFEAGADRGSRLWQSMLPDETSGNRLTNREARSALEAAFSRVGRKAPVDILFFDTCLNGSVEVYAELGRFAEVFVGSSYLIAKAGWNYRLWLDITGQRMPESAAEWADLAVKVYDVVYDQRAAEEPEPAHLVATRWEPELLEAFAGLVEALSGLEPRVAKGLVKAAGLRSAGVFYKENLDLRQLVRRVRGLAEADGLVGVREAAERFLGVQERAVVSETRAKDGVEGLCGMTVWCPVYGDLEDVGRYYGGLEFCRRTGWGRIVGQGLV